MKEVVVVVDRRGRTQRVFSGKDLQVIDRSEAGSYNTKLIVKERGEKCEKAVFRQWIYWYEVSEEAGDEIAGHYLADFGVKIPVTKKFLKNNPQLLKSIHLVDLDRYSSEDEDEFKPEKTAEKKISEKKPWK